MGLCLLCLTLVQCSVSRQNVSTADAGKPMEERLWGRKDYLHHNLDVREWWIPKVQLEYINGGESDKYLAYIKRNAQADLLLSLRNRTGVEGFRILLTQDSAFIIDRLKRQLHYGKISELLHEYGIGRPFISLLFGDVPDIHFQISHKQDTSRFHRLHFLTGRKFKMTAVYDRKVGKLTECTLHLPDQNERILFVYSDFTFKGKQIIIPTSVDVRIPERKLQLKLNIMDIRTGEYGKWNWQVKDAYERVLIR